MRKALALLIPFATAACVNTADISMRNAPPDFGSAMSQAQCQSIARRHVEPFLQRPSSAQYKWGRCSARTLKAKPWLGLPKQSGYAIDLSVNSRNAWGRYTGFTRYSMLIHDGQVVRRLRESRETGALERY